MRQAILAALFLPLLLPAQSDAPTESDPGVRFVDAFPAQDKFDRPLYLDHHSRDPDHYWVVEQFGRIWRIPADEKSKDRQQVADFGEIAFHPNNGGHNEEGLLGFAFHPDWQPAGGSVFVYYSNKTGGEGKSITRESVIQRYTTTTDKNGAVTIGMDSAVDVMRVEQPWGNHNGGTIVFGPDGMLYVALGDGGAANDRGGNGQNLETLLGSILRIDVSKNSAAEPYRIPDDNPFVGTPDACPEIWAYGLRNPWRFSFDRETGRMWAGDVGQNLWEEVGEIVAGGNHGWPLMEGFHEFPPEADRDPEELNGLVAPLAEYPHSAGISVTGGFVYRGAALPQLEGRFVYADFAFRTVWAAKASDDPQAPDVLELGKASGPVAAFAEEPDGELLMLCFDGRIQRLVSAAQ